MTFQMLTKFTNDPIAMFYVITVVVGLCANRCLSREIDEEDEEGEGIFIDPPAEPPDIFLPDEGFPQQKSSQLELVQLIESYHNNNDSDTPCSSAATDSTVRENTIFSAKTQRPIGNNVADASGPNYHSPMKSRNRAKVGGFTPDSIDELDSGDNWETRNCLPHNHEEEHDKIEILSPTRKRGTPRITGEHELPKFDESDRWSSRTEFPKPVPPGGRYLLAEKNVGVVLGSLSILAIKTGGVFSNSIAQEIYEQGLLWCQVPVASSLSLIIGGALFARILYSEGYVTMLDPFQDIYGVRVGAIQFIPVLIADMIFAAVILSSLGALLQITLGFTQTFGIVISLISVLLYLIAGGLYAGTFTDAAQFIYLCLGSWLLVPFVLSNDSTKSISSTFPKWLGKVEGRFSGLYIDQMAVLILGGIPMQSYFQRVLSSRSSKSYRIITLAGCLGCLTNAVPALLIGAAAASTDFSNTTFGEPVRGANITTILPISIAHLVPSGVLFLALGALASGLLASCDSAIFGLATMLSQNIYKNWLRPQATDKELIWLARLAVVAVSLVILLLCLLWPKWHHYWILPYDILYVLVFPQLFCVVYFKYSNTYGAIAGLIVGTTLRILFGEAKINFTSALPLPFWDKADGQLFPYRTLAMLANMLTVIFVSVLYDYLHSKGKVGSPNDIFLCFSSAQRRASRTRIDENQTPQGRNIRETSRTLNDIRYLSGHVQLETTVERMTVV